VEDATLSICVIVKNEAALLHRCLESVKSVADEIVVVDTGSTDDTIAIARGLGAKVIESLWRNDFAFSRNVSIEHATCRWILWLDADDVVPAASLQEIYKLKFRTPDCVFSFIVRNERPGNTGSEFTQARMFPRHPALRFERSIHEQIMPSALRIGMKLEPCSIIVEHHGYAEAHILKKKAARNVAMLLSEYPAVAPDAVMATEIADSCWLVDDLDSALTWYTEVLRLLGDSGESATLESHALYGIGNIENRQGRYTEAINRFEKAHKRAPWRPDILYSLAVALELSGHPEKAVPYLERIGTMEAVAGQVGVDFRSARIKACLRLVRILVEINDREHAAKVVADALVTFGNRPEIQNAAGKYFLKMGRLMDALHAFEASIALHRNGNLDAFTGLCCVYYIAGRTQLVTETLTMLTTEYRENRRFDCIRALFSGSAETILSIQSEHADLVRDLQREFYGMLPSGT